MVLCNGFYVFFVAVGAYHDDACSEFGVHEIVWNYFDFSLGNRNQDFFTYVFLEALIIWINGDCNASR